MRSLAFSFMILLGSTATLAQSTSTPPTPKAKAPQTQVSPSAAAMLQQAGISKALTENSNPSPTVVTLNGVCDAPKKGVPCKTLVTKAEIDTMAMLLDPGATPAARQQFAINYARLVAAYGVAEKQHLDKEPAIAAAVQLQEKLVRMQVLANIMYQRIENQSGTISPAEVEAYYAAHKNNFEEGSVSRLTIPKPTSSMPGTGGAEDVSLREKATAFRTRLVAGEDIDKLQQEIYKESAPGSLIPPTKVANLRRAMLGEQDSKVFDLALGSVSEVLETPSAFLVLRMDAKESLPLDTVRTEILGTLRRERVQHEIEKASLGSDAEFNLRFLGMPSAPAIFPPPEIVQLAGTTGLNPAPQKHSARRLAPAKRHMVTAVPGGQQPGSQMR